MGRKNRKVSKRMSVVAGHAVRFGAVIVMFFVMAIVYLLAKSSCEQLSDEIRDKEHVLAKLEDEQDRESARWEEMKTPDRLEAALLRHGLSMKYPRPDQVVRVRADGTLLPGQPAVARAAQRSRAVSTAQNVRGSRRR